MDVPTAAPAVIEERQPERRDTGTAAPAAAASSAANKEEQVGWEALDDDSHILRFYIGGGEDPLGRTHEEMINYTDARMEQCHDYVQFLFPSAERSFFASIYPVLNQAQADALRASPAARARLLAAVARFKSFLGVEPEDASKWPNWCSPGDHNLLRVTRIIRCLRIFGLEDEAAAFHAAVTSVAGRVSAAGGGGVFGGRRMAGGPGAEALRYWQAALTEPPMVSLRDAMAASARRRAAAVGAGAGAAGPGYNTRSREREREREREYEGQAGAGAGAGAGRQSGRGGGGMGGVLAWLLNGGNRSSEEGDGEGQGQEERVRPRTGGGERGDEREAAAEAEAAPRRQVRPRAEPEPLAQSQSRPLSPAAAAAPAPIAAAGPAGTEMATTMKPGVEADTSASVAVDANGPVAN